ncbi:MAG: 4Fe-4S binding protein [Synergistaceae bacterium]|jgi:formate hydrogenlyase subunit 6/NADH:ubiquinone oxidoreductase subunit I|nr:4Fe-4S binding protein [Synergistaceae bacterium]
MITRVLPQLLRQLCSRAVTNLFPSAHMPPSLTAVLSDPEVSPNPPVPVGKRFRGRLHYDRSKCIGCRLCVKVCPANATDYLAEEKKIVIHNDRCCFCAQCTEICPVKCLTMSETYMISSYARRENVVADSGPLPAAEPKA